MKKQLLQVIFALSIMTGTVYAQPGSLDAAFNGKGIKTFSFGTNTQSENVTASYLQPDGKLLVAMTSSAGGSFDTTSYVARFMPDGSADLTFGVGGKKELDPKFLFGGTAYFVAYAIAVQNDGTIVLGGTRRNFDYDYPCIVSLKANGAFNELFANGTACVVFGEQNNMLKSISIHKKTGNIWACGGSPTYGYSSFFICALTRTGQTFTGDGGIVYGNYFPDGVYYEYATSSVMKGDVFYMAGPTKSYDARKHFGVMALDVTNSSLSGTFFNYGEGGTGTVMLPMPGEVPASTHGECTALAFSPDSTSLFLGGYAIDTNQVTDVSFMLAKVNLKDGGYIDTLFSADGISTYKMAGTTQNYLRGLSIDAGGKMMLAGTLTNSLSYWTALRLLPDGTIDPSFGTAGRKVYDGNNGNSLINSFHLVGLHYNSTSKKYVFTGHYQGTVNTDGLAKRISYNGDADNTFGNSSQIVFSGKEDNAILRDVSARGDGKLIICGAAQNADSGENMIALLNADGSQDKTFGNIGMNSLLPALPEAKIMDVEVLSNNKILVAGYYLNTSDDAQDVFVLRLNDNGTLDPGFNGTGYFTYRYSAQNDFAQGILLRSDGGILLYGFFFNGTNFNPGVLQLSANGALNTGFGASGISIYPEDISEVDGLFKNMDAKVRADDKVIVGAYHYNGSNYDMLVYRLTSTGGLDSGFGTSGAFIGDYGYAADQYIYGLSLTSDDKIVAAGQTSDEGGRDNVLVMLTKDGMLDTTFATSGWMVLNKSYSSEAFTYVTVNNNKIIATGLVLKYNSVTSEDDSYFTAARFTLNGLLDNTFANRGYTIIEQAYPFNSYVSGNKLYFTGADRKLDGQTTYKGIIGRINLGAGPVVKVTNLQAADFNKFLGDEPFLLTTVSNSPGPKTYRVSSSARGCVAVDQTSGLVTMTCATVNSSPVIIQIIQPAVSGFTADTAYSNINVGKGIPKITFNPQGDTLTGTFPLQVYTTSDGYPQYYVTGGDYNAVYLNGDGTAYANAEGCTDVQVYFYETDNYQSGSVTTSVCAYLHLIPPASFDDNISLSYPVEGPVYFSPLANDESYTGTINASGLDLDPSTPGIQHSYNAPAIGKFEADTITGIVTYTAFDAFLGKNSIDYVVYDSKGSASPRSKIYVTVTPPKDVSDLKATELFTPNNDGLNDAFVIGHIVVPNENQLRVFDRNGQEIYTKNNYQNDWKGELENGTSAENGIYYFTYTENDGTQTRELRGAVELRR